MMTQMRDATTKDVYLIQSLAEVIWHNAYAGILSPQQMRYMLDTMYSPAALQRQMKEGQQFLLLKEKVEALGFASFSRMAEARYKLNKLYVLPSLQKRSLGSTLLEEVITRVRAAGGKELLLNVNRRNKAKGFYERLGFEVIGEEDIDIGSGYFMNDFVMRLLL